MAINSDLDDPLDRASVIDRGDAYRFEPFGTTVSLVPTPSSSFAKGRRLGAHTLAGS